MAMISHSLTKTPLASLSRPVCGVFKKSLIITLPGSSKGALENLEAIFGVLPHALELIRGEKNAGETFHQKLHGGHSCVHHSDTLTVTESTTGLSNDPSQSVTKRARVSPYPIIPFEKALEIVLEKSKCRRENTVLMSILDPSIKGHILAADVESKVNVPAYRASIVDGYAIVHTDGPGVYKVISSSTAGSKVLDMELKPGFVCRVSTGAPVPLGATAVVMVEDTRLGASSPDESQELEILVQVSCNEDQNIRSIGSDVQSGEKVLEKGHEMSSFGGEIALLASIGVLEVLIMYTLYDTND